MPSVHTVSLRRREKQRGPLLLVPAHLVRFTSNCFTVGWPSCVLVLVALDDARWAAFAPAFVLGSCWVFSVSAPPSPRAPAGCFWVFAPPGCHCFPVRRARRHHRCLWRACWLRRPPSALAVCAAPPSRLSLVLCALTRRSPPQVPKSTASGSSSLPSALAGVPPCRALSLFFHAARGRQVLALPARFRALG